MKLPRVRDVLSKFNTIISRTTGAFKITLFPNFKSLWLILKKRKFQKFQWQWNKFGNGLRVAIKIFWLNYPKFWGYFNVARVQTMTRRCKKSLIPMFFSQNYYMNSRINAIQVAVCSVLLYCWLERYRTEFAALISVCNLFDLDIWDLKNSEFLNAPSHGLLLIFEIMISDKKFAHQRLVPFTKLQERSVQYDWSL